MHVDDAKMDELISIHALREESDNPCRYASRSIARFQSTFSVRRATSSVESAGSCLGYFNPRSP